MAIEAGQAALAAKIARKIKQAQAEVAELEEYINNLKSEEAGILGIDPDDLHAHREEIVGDAENGYLKVVAYTHKQFNEAWGRKEHPELWEKLAVEKKVLDSATFKAAIAAKRATDEDYELFQKPGKITVKVEALKDGE
jgi:hypothetical protein